MATEQKVRQTSELVACLKALYSQELKELARALSTDLQPLDFDGKVNIVLLGNNLESEKFIEWYTGQSIQEVSTDTQVLIVESDQEAAVTRGDEAMEQTNAALRLGRMEGLEKGVVRQTLICNSRELESITFIRMPHIHGTQVREADSFRHDSAIAKIHTYLQDPSIAAKMKKAFEDKDSDKDGIASLEKFEQVMVDTQLNLESEELAFIFNAFDISSEGEFFYEDFLSVFTLKNLSYPFPLEDIALRLAEIADMLIIFHDPKFARFNLRALSLIKLLHDTHRSKINMYCFLNDRYSKDHNLDAYVAAFAAHLSNRLGEPSLKNVQHIWTSAARFSVIGSNALPELCESLAQRVDAHIEKNLSIPTRFNVESVTSQLIRDGRNHSKVESFSSLLSSIVERISNQGAKDPRIALLRDLCARCLGQLKESSVPDPVTPLQPQPQSVVENPVPGASLQEQSKMANSNQKPPPPTEKNPPIPAITATDRPSTESMPVAADSKNQVSENMKEQSLTTGAMEPPAASSNTKEQHPGTESSQIKDLQQKLLVGTKTEVKLSSESKNPYDLPPLPPDWDEIEDDGRRVYVNLRLKQRQSTRPAVTRESAGPLLTALENLYTDQRNPSALSILARDLGSVIEKPHLNSKASILLLGNGIGPQLFIEYYTNARITYTDDGSMFVVVEKGSSHEVKKSESVLEKLPNASKLRSLPGVSRSCVLEQLPGHASPDRDFDCLRFIRAPFVEAPARRAGGADSSLARIRERIQASPAGMEGEFRAMCATGTQCVTRLSFEKAVVTMGLEMPVGDVSKAFEELDVAGHGAVGFEEFSAAFRPGDANYLFEDLEDVLVTVADGADLVIILPDPYVARYNPREVQAYGELFRRFPGKVLLHFFLHDRHAHDSDLARFVGPFSAMMRAGWEGWDPVKALHWSHCHEFRPSTDLLNDIDQLVNAISLAVDAAVFDQLLRRIKDDLTRAMNLCRQPTVDPLKGVLLRSWLTDFARRFETLHDPSSYRFYLLCQTMSADDVEGEAVGGTAEAAIAARQPIDPLVAVMRSSLLRRGNAAAGEGVPRESTVRLFSNIADLYHDTKDGLLALASELSLQMPTALLEPTRAINVLLVGCPSACQCFLEHYTGRPLQSAARRDVFVLVQRGPNPSVRGGREAFAAAAAAFGQKLERVRATRGCDEAFVREEIDSDRGDTMLVNFLLAPQLEGCRSSGFLDWRAGAVLDAARHLGPRREALLRRFRYYDTNGDRMLELHNLQAALQSADGGMRPDKVDELCRVLDLPEDAKVDYVDFLAAISEPDPPPPLADPEAVVTLAADAADLVLILFSPTQARVSLRQLSLFTTLRGKHAIKTHLYAHLDDYRQAVRHAGRLVRDCGRVLARWCKDEALASLKMWFRVRNPPLLFDGVLANHIGEISARIAVACDSVIEPCVAAALADIRAVRDAVSRRGDSDMFRRFQELCEAYFRLLSADRDFFNLKLSSALLQASAGGPDPDRVAGDLRRGGAGRRRSSAWAEDEGVRAQVAAGDAAAWGTKQHVILWLQLVGLGQYSSGFLAAGVGDGASLLRLSADDMPRLGVIDPAHRDLLLRELSRLSAQPAAAAVAGVGARRRSLHTPAASIPSTAAPVAAGTGGVGQAEGNSGKASAQSAVADMSAAAAVADWHRVPLWALLERRAISPQELLVMYGVVSGAVAVPEHKFSALEFGLRYFDAGAVTARSAAEICKDVRRTAGGVAGRRAASSDVS